MGSFNTACMVSQQVIIPGTEVIILPIEQQATYEPVELFKDGQKLSRYGFSHTTVYPTAFWGYAGPIIRGQYEDYGCFEIFNTPENKENLITFFNTLLKDSYNTKKGENEYHEHAFNMSEIYDNNKKYSFKNLIAIWDKVWEVADENRLFLDNYKKEPRNLQFAVIHHAAANYLIESVNKIISYDSQSYEQKTYFKNFVQKELKKMLEIFKEKDINKTFSFFASQISSLSGYGIGDNEGCYIPHYYKSYTPIMDLICNYTDKNPNIKQIPDHILDKMFKHFKLQLDHRYIQMALTHFNIKLSPMVYASQDYSNKTGQMYVKMIQEVSKLVVEEIKENNGDYDEE